MSGYATIVFTCGVCGDSYSADGVVGDLKVERWAREHKAAHERRGAQDYFSELARIKEDLRSAQRRASCYEVADDQL